MTTKKKLGKSKKNQKNSGFTVGGGVKLQELAELVSAQCVAASGWSTDSEHKRYLEAVALVGRHARKAHLEAELAALKNSGPPPTTTAEKS